MKVSRKTASQIRYMKQVSHRSANEIAQKLNVGVKTVKSVR